MNDVDKEVRSIHFDRLDFCLYLPTMLPLSATLSRRKAQRLISKIDHKDLNFEKRNDNEMKEFTRKLLSYRSTDWIFISFEISSF